VLIQRSKSSSPAQSASVKNNDIKVIFQQIGSRAGALMPEIVGSDHVMISDRRSPHPSARSEASDCFLPGYFELHCCCSHTKRSGSVMRQLVFVTVLLAANLVAFAAVPQEYFGRFTVDLSGTFVDRSSDRPMFRLDSDFGFIDPNGFEWPVPSGTLVDGASIPEWLWVFAAPFSGDYLWASVVHDYYCDTRTRTAHDTHRSFYYGMLASGVERWKADFMYWAVSTFGPRWTLTGAVQAIDFSNPVVAAAARSKAAAVSRTLNWSDGEFLDAGEGRVLVEANLQNIEASAAKYRAALTSGDFISDPSSMGVLSSWTTDIASSQWRNDFWLHAGIGFKGDPEAAFFLSPADQTLIEAWFPGDAPADPPSGPYSEAEAAYLAADQFYMRSID
jgi:hypothetical protein